MYAREKNGDLYNGVLRDCADNGVSFFSPCPYLPGTKLYLKTEKHMDSSVQPAMVTWSKPQSHGANSRLKFRVGVKYTNV